ncbi:hypothetical protein CXB49_10800 [Chromobacterium sp. ATCC 53434]|uniref:hypothetical protein n=1 Tax=Chromobacterium sp. (strain ATCC 53434 / SC 14030) TaxID=2059672 RepID=UPI000C7931FD|nr:hypothetical protein [Chromobacterium sp. ATCC 53434]AUH51264.1 hypothetical protein CXB49_10800 [Chromobacterium sp. ATCC 53434]
MKIETHDISETIAEAVQIVGAAVACGVAIWWAWSLAAGSVVGFVLLLLLAVLFIAPLVAWGLPMVALVLGALVRVIRSDHSIPL